MRIVNKDHITGQLSLPQIRGRVLAEDFKHLPGNLLGAAVEGVMKGFGHVVERLVAFDDVPPRFYAEFP